MKDNDLIRVFLPIIVNGLIDYGYTGVVIQQANQPTQQGIPTSPTVYFFKVMDHRYGFLKRDDTWDDVNSVMVHTETQIYETTFQINTLVLQDVSNTNGYTASDLCNAVSDILQSDTTLQTLSQNDIGIYRITDINNPYFTDDRDNFEASPFFSFTLTHRNVRVTETPIIETIEPGIYRV